MPRRQRRARRKRRPRGVPRDDPGRDQQRRWRRQVREVLAVSLEVSQRDPVEPENAGRVKRRRLLISLAAFLEPGRRRRLGAEGAWGVFRAFRELAEAGGFRLDCPPPERRPLDDPESVNDRPRKASP